MLLSHKWKVVRRQLAVFSFLTADFGDDTASYKASVGRGKDSSRRLISFAFFRATF